MTKPVERALGSEAMNNMTEMGAMVVPPSGGTVLNDPTAAKRGAPEVNSTAAPTTGGTMPTSRHSPPNRRSPSWLPN